MDKEQVREDVREIFGWPGGLRQETEEALEKLIDYILGIKE